MFQHFFENKADTLFENGLMPKLSRYQLSDDPNWQSGYHVHKTETELLYVAKGKVAIDINSSSYTAPQGSIIVIEKEKIHTVTSDSIEPAVTCAFGIYDYKIHGFEKVRLTRPNTYPIVTEVKYQELLTHVINGINSIASKPCQHPELSICNALATILAIIYYENFQKIDTQKTPLPKQFFIQNILKYLDDNYREKITLQNLAVRFNVSVSYISHEFSKNYKTSPINYVIKRRMTEAKLALTNSNLSLNEISFQVGYNNVDHFTKLFVNHVGCTPSEYRKQFKRSIV